MAGALKPHDKSNVDEEDDPRYPEVGEPVKARNHVFSHDPDIIRPQMLLALLVEEEEGS